jgi:hypothetical protein
MIMKIITLKNNRDLGAKIVATQLINENKRICYLEGFGPSSEVRCFAQLLRKGDSDLSVPTETDQVNTIRKTIIPDTCDIRVVALQNDYMAILVVPSNTTYLVADTEEQLFKLFSRELDQKHFGCKVWYETIYQETMLLHPIIGDKACRVNNINVHDVISEKLSSNTFAIPTTEHEINIEVAEDSDNQAA